MLEWLGTRANHWKAGRRVSHSKKSLIDKPARSRRGRAPYKAKAGRVVINVKKGHALFGKSSPQQYDWVELNLVDDQCAHLPPPNIH
eukprot:38709-Amphidinium_carterae.1